MNGHDHRTHAGHASPEPNDARRTVRARWVFWAFAAIAAVFLVKEHGAHLLGALPWLLIAACPLLHMSMHGGHGGHGAHRDSRRGGEPPTPAAKPGEGR